MAEQVYVNFPSQIVSDLEKISPEYGLKVALAIEKEWFNEANSNRYRDVQNKFHLLKFRYFVKM